MSKHSLFHLLIDNALECFFLVRRGVQEVSAFADKVSVLIFPWSQAHGLCKSLPSLKKKGLCKSHALHLLIFLVWSHVCRSCSWFLWTHTHIAGTCPLWRLNYLAGKKKWKKKKKRKKDWTTSKSLELTVWPSIWIGLGLLVLDHQYCCYNPNLNKSKLDIRQPLLLYFKSQEGLFINDWWIQSCYNTYNIASTFFSKL